MAATDRVPAPGTKVRIKSGGTWSDLLGVTGVPGQDITAGDIDATEIDPYAGGTTPLPSAMVFFKSFIQGWKDAGELPLELNLTQQQYAALLALVSVGTTNTGTMIAVHFTNGYAFVCAGYVKSLGTAAAEGDNMVKSPVTFKLTGVPTFLTHAAANAL